MGAYNQLTPGFIVNIGILDLLKGRALAIKDLPKLIIFIRQLIKQQNLKGIILNYFGENQIFIFPIPIQIGGLDGFLVRTGDRRGIHSAFHGGFHRRPQIVVSFRSAGQAVHFIDGPGAASCQQHSQ